MGAFEHAIVLGIGTAGLVSARVLSEHFDRVMVYEKDPDPQGPGFRNGIPQGRHFHALIPWGLVIMAELFPGLQEDLKTAGSILPKPDEFYFYTPMGKSYAIGAFVPEPPPDTGAQVFFFADPRVTRIYNPQPCRQNRQCRVRLRRCHQGSSVTDKRVTGIQLESGDVVSADLVIDAMGRQGRTLTWLKEMGYDQPKEDVITCDFAYSSVFMKPKDPSLSDDVGFFVSADPNGEHPRRGGALVRMEDGTWVTSVGGRYGDYPPRDIDGFREFVETLPDTSPYKALVRQYEPSTTSHTTGSRRTDDDTLNNWTSFPRDCCRSVMQSAITTHFTDRE